jgi:site-specific DNA-methyltransferase (adenine-specific)
MGNQLWFGDNLAILREEIADESVDLVYLDPPFNSQANYNVLFKTPDDDAASAQVEAFRDTWTWGAEAEWAHQEIMRTGGGVASIINALHSALGDSDMMAYLVMMAQRLHELRRVLRSTGSLYLHCDPTASHYLKIILDAVFGARCFRTEIVWKRSTSHGNVGRSYGDLTDTILFFTRSANGSYTWNQQYRSYSEEYQLRYNMTDPDGRRWQSVSLRNPGLRPNLKYPYTASNGVTYYPHPNGWAVGRDRMEKYDRENRLYFPTRPGGQLRLKQFLDERQGTKLQNLWDDIPAVNSQAQERLGYPTQKPIALLERIISTSSNSGDLVLDPFCGCGTSVHAAQRLGRQWIGIDVAYHAIRVIEDRLSMVPGRVTYDVGGIPKDFPSAARLAENDKYQFQWWANYLVGVQALKEVRKGPDRGIDGQMFFMNGPRGWGRVLTSVKGGQHVGAKDVREFKAVIERERAEMGLFICLREPTREMRSEAAGFGFVDTAHGHLPRLQIVSIEHWFAGGRPVLPSLGHVSREFFQPSAKSAKQARRPDPNAPEFPFSFTGDKKDSVVHFNPATVRREAETTGLFR